MANSWRSYFHIPQLLRSAKVGAYFDAIEKEFGDSATGRDKDWNLHQWFFDTVQWWWDGKIETPDLIHWMSFTSLVLNPALFQDLSILLECNSERVVVSTSDDDQVVEYAILLSSHQTDSEAQIIPISTFAKNASCEIRDTRIVRQILDTSEPLSYFLDIDTFWTPGVMELLQFELDRPTAKDVYRRKCMRCIRGLERKYHVLPPSLFLKHVVRDGSDALSGGGFADIWKGRFCNKTVCIKVPRMFTASDQKTKDVTAFAFRHEALLWRQLNHPNVLPFLGVNVNLFTPARLCLISPWMENGNIIQYLTNHPGHDLLCTISEIAAGLNYLHNLSPPIVHGDIRGANILVTPDSRCCLADFGLSLATETTQVFTTTSDGVKGCVRWLAPECITPGKLPDPDLERDTWRKCRDIYAFGCTIIEVITLKPPFHNRPMDAGVIIDVTRGKRPERPQGSDVWCPDNIWDLVECCWAQEPRNRPHAYEVKRFLDFLRREKGQEKRVRLREWYLYSYSQSEESLAVLGADSIGIDLDIDQRSMKTVLNDGASMLLSTIKAGSVGDGGDDAQQSPSITTYPGTQNALSKEAASSSNSLMQPEEMIKNLEDRVRDWKGYSLESFGLPLLQGVFDITENMSDARYHVFLFERVLLCLEKSNPWKRLSPILEESSLTPEITPTQSLNETSPLWTLRRAIFLFNVVLMQRDADSLVISLQEDNGADFFILHCADAAQRDLWQSTITELTVGDSVTRFIRDALFDAVDADTEEDEEKTSSLQESHTKEVPVPGSWLHLYRDGDGLNDDDHAGRLSPSSVLGSIMDLPDLDLDILPLSAGGTDTSSMWSDHWHEDVNNEDHNYNTSAIKVAGSSGNNFNTDLMEEMFYSSIPYSEPSPPKYRERPMVRFELGAEGRKLDDAVTTPLHTKSASMVSGWEPWDKETEERTNDLSLSTVMGTILNKAWRMGR